MSPRSPPPTKADGAGLTWGIIGFTLGHGDLRDVILTVQSQYPEAVPNEFGPLANEPLDTIAPDFSNAHAWANPIGEGPKRYAVRKDCRNAATAAPGMAHGVCAA
jgi:hypothetical protein